MANGASIRRGLKARINGDAVRLAAPLQKFIGRSEECSVAERHAKNLAEFMNDLGLPHLLGKLRMTLVSENKREEAAEYRRLWEITVRALEQCTAVLGNTSMDMEEFGKLFTRMLGRLTSTVSKNGSSMILSVRASTGL